MEETLPCMEEIVGEIQVPSREEYFGILSATSNDCLQVMVYIRMTEAPVLFKTDKNLLSRFNIHPIFTNGNIQLTTAEDILAYLCERHYNLDYNLSPKQCSEVYAFSNMVKLHMQAITQYIWWLDSKNYEHWTLTWYSRNLSLPFCKIYPHVHRKAAKCLVDEIICIAGDAESDVVGKHVYSIAAEIFATIAVRLGSSEYFYGNSPSSLDVTVYAFLAPLVYIPFPSQDIGELLNSWPSLVNFVKRISSRVFPNNQFEAIALNKNSVQKIDKGLKASNGQFVFAVMCISVFMAGVLLSRNLNDAVKFQWKLLTDKC